jgi:AP-3 complex subunit beta
MICAKANGYQELPDWPEVAPDPAVRNVEVPVPWPSTSSSKVKASKKKPEKTKSFYSEDESSSSEGNILVVDVETPEYFFSVI